jgi:hypothetical protein
MRDLKICCVEGCAQPAVARLRCLHHYGEYYRMTPQQRAAEDSKPKFPKWTYEGNEQALSARFGENNGNE